MILEKETREKIGVESKDAKQRQKIICKCDYCGAIFERLKHNLIRSYTNIQTDSCSETVCVQKKRVEVSQKLFGTDNVFQNESIKQKIGDKLEAEHGHRHPMQITQIKDKHKETVRRLYNVDNVFQNETIKKKIKQHFQSTHNVDNAFQVPEIQQKQRRTMKEEYDVEHALQKPEFRQKAQETCIINNGCFPANHYGKAQSEIQEWLNSFGFDFQSNRKLIPGSEIDLFDTNKKLAIEYCGLHWHHELSPEPRLRDYHDMKYKKCLEQGVQLLTIFSDEWLERTHQCQGHIKSILGVVDQKIHGRKCEVQEITKEVGRDFFEQNHIQGKNSLGVVFFGLFHDNELCGAISLGRHNRNIDKIVLDRLCFKHGIQIVGGASKLFKQCINWAKSKDYKEILSFSDNRWSLGKIYKTLEFTLEKDYSPDYSYVNIKRPDTRLSKQSQKKSATGCPENITEYAWSLDNGLARIWDCGKKRWSFKL